MRVVVRRVDYREVLTVEDLVAPVSPADLFTPAERAHCEAGRGLDRWAGRLAAKRAVADLLGVEPAAVEIVPGEHPPHLPVTARCERGHPPRAVLWSEGGPSRAAVAVSISHDHGFAAAIAMT